MSTPRSTTGVFRQILPTPRSTPVSVTLLAITTVLAVAARVPAIVNEIHEVLTFTWGQLSAGRIWTPFSALLVPGHIDAWLIQALVLLFVAPTLERRYGSRRFVLSFFILGGLANLLGGALVALLAHAGEPWAVNASRLLVGDPSVGLVALLASYIPLASPLWRRRGTVVLVTYIAITLAFAGQPSDVSRAIAAGLGWTLGLWKARTISPHPAVHRMLTPGHEIRVLGSTVVAMLACGPVVSVLSRASLGLLSPSLVLVDNAAYQAEQPCSVVAFGKQCGDWLVWGLQAHQRTTAWIQLLPVLLLLLAAYGLMRGRRAAVWIAALLLVRNAVGVTIVFIRGFQRHGHVVTDVSVLRHTELVIQVAIVIVVNVGVAVMLIRQRRSWEVQLSRRGAYLGWFIALCTVSASALAYMCVGVAVRDHVDSSSSALRLLVSGLALPLPPSARMRLGLAVHTTSWEARLPLIAIEATMWIVLIILTYRVVTAGLWREGPSLTQVRERLHIGGSSHLSFMATWPGNLLWQDAVTGAIVAYRPVAGIALTLSEPFGAPHADLMGIVTRFHSYADTHGLTPVWYSVDHESFGPIAERLGWQSVEVAQESVVNVREWKTVGKAWQDVRSALSRAKREGITAEWTTWKDMTVGSYAQVVALSEEWVSDHPLPEMGFTLGGLDQLHDPDVRLMVATSEDGRVEGILSWLPTWRDGVVIGWTLDFMRRHSDSMPGLIEFLIAESAMLMKDEGIEFMSLSGAPLAGSGSEGDSTQLEALLRFISETLEPVYGFQSLHRFKQKFQPDVRTWTMVFPSALDLPAIGIAVTRSYLPHLSVVEAARAIAAVV